jgi:hypothetical protein
MCNSMNSNIRFIICPDAGRFKVIVAYEGEEIAWRGFDTITQAGQRILRACENLEKGGNAR